MTADPPIEIRVLSQPENLAAVRSALETMAKRMGMDEKRCGELVIAVDEAMTNIIRHGYKGSPDQPIFVRIWAASPNGRKAVKVEIIDACPNATPQAIAARPVDLENPTPGGLGVTLIQRSMDHVEVASRDDAPGLRLSMYKYIQPDTEPEGNGP